MPNPERPSQFSSVPELYPRTEFIPAVAITKSVVTAPQAVVSVEPPAPTGGHDQTAHDEPAIPVIAGVSKEPELRVTLAGRLGADPSFRTTPKGRLVGKFPLGVRDEADDGTTRWETVLTFDKRAEHVRATLKKGDAVAVIGYRHERQVPGRNGPRTIEEIYATVVRPR